MNLNIEINDETADEILIQSLQQQYESLKYHLDCRKDGRESLGFFFSEKEKDIAEITRHLNGFEIVLNFYMLKEDFEEWKAGGNDV